MPQIKILMYLLYERDVHTGKNLQTKLIKVMACSIAHMTTSDLHNHILARLKEVAVAKWNYTPNGNVLQSLYANDQIGYKKLDAALLVGISRKPINPKRGNFLRIRNYQQKYASTTANP